MTCILRPFLVDFLGAQVATLFERPTKEEVGANAWHVAAMLAAKRIVLRTIILICREGVSSRAVGIIVMEVKRRGTKAIKPPIFLFLDVDVPIIFFG